MTEAQLEGSLQVSNMEVINNLSTESVDEFWDNLWANCGASVDGSQSYRIVEPTSALMQEDGSLKQLFY